MGMMTDRYRVIQGDCREGLCQLDAESVQCCVTSPPYWGLRDYGTGRWEGGDPTCPHAPRPQVSNKEASNNGALRDKPTSVCKCGAQRVDRQLGLEKTPDEYVEKMVAVFSEVWRVLKPDATLWLNLGDSYASDLKGGGGKANSTLNAKRDEDGLVIGKSIVTYEPRRLNHGLKPKDLCMIPARVALALQAAGWYLRSDIIWAKPNCMPESVTDRPTRSHEYLFLLTKQPKYYYDAEAIAEPASYAMYAQVEDGYNGEALKDYGANGVQNPSSVKSRIIENARNRSKKRGEYNGKTNGLPGREAFCAYTITRNKRDVWTVSPACYPDAHFATFPPDLIRPCILAGSKPGDVILDPFGGSGTTGQVALELGRQAVLCELNPQYIELIHQRCNVTPGLHL